MAFLLLQDPHTHTITTKIVIIVFQSTLIRCQSLEIVIDPRDFSPFVDLIHGNHIITTSFMQRTRAHLIESPFFNGKTAQETFYPSEKQRFNQQTLFRRETKHSIFKKNQMRNTRNDREKM